MWEIKGKNNQVKATINSLEYNGEWMGESYVTVTVESPAPVNFEIGDYIIYRDERFEINYDPGKIKSAPRYEKGDAFKYENIKFNSLADELTRCDFRDLVLQDNNLHFTSLPKFPFYGGVRDLANRIQANLDKLYTGANKWTVIVSPEFQDDKELNVQIDNIKVQGALEILVNQFETYYTISGRTITIGAAGIPAGHLFKYGKGNGLYEIEQNAEADQAIVTRLRAYGSTRNLPHRYYNSLSGADGQKLIPDNMAVQHLMLPEFPYTTQDPYIDSPNIAKLGIREGTIFFDGSGELEEIYPSIEGMTAEQLKAAGVPCNSTGALDEIVSAEQMTDNGVGEINEGETQTTAKPPTFKVTLKDLGFDINDHKTTETATISFKTGMLGGRDFEIVGCKKIESGGKVTSYELELNRVYDDGIKLWFPYSAYNAQAGDKFVLLYIKMPEVYIKAAAQRLKEAATEWLSKNDYSRSIYAPKVDEIFMARQHDLAMASGGKIKSLHDTLKEGMLLLFEDEDLNIDASIFIDRLTIKEEGAVPTYEVVLKEEKTVGRLDKMQNQIDSLVAGKGQSGGGYTAAQIRSMIEAYGDTRFLSKIKDDRTPYKISTDKAFEVGEYLAGVSGGIFGKDATGDSFAEVARLYVRVKAFFEELTVVKAGVLAGKQYITPGGGIRCTRVEEVTDGGGSLTAYRCWFLSGQDGENTECMYSSGDQAISEMFNAVAGTSNKVSNHRYWRLVTAVNNDAYADGSGNHYGYIDLSKTDCEPGSDTPQEGDEICQLGSRNDKTRQTAMVFSTVDADAPSVKLYSGIDSYSLAGKAVVSFGRDPITGRIFFRLGADGDRQYLRYSQDGGLEVAGKISSKSTYDDGSGSDATLGDVINDRIADTDILFISHTSQTVAPALPLLDADGGIALMNGWTTDAPEVQPGRYIWHTTYVLRGDGTAYFTPAVCISGGTGSGLKTGIRPASAEDWTLADLQRFAANDGEKWSVMNATDFNIGDTCVLNLVIKDLDNAPCQYFGVVMSIEPRTPTSYAHLLLKDQRFIYGHPGSNYTENLVTGSRSGIGWSGYTRLNDGVFEKDNSSTTENYIFAPDITVEAGKKYTLSFQAKATANLRNADLFLIGVPGFIQNSFSPTTQWQSFRFVNTSPQSRSGAPRFDNNASTDGATATLYIRDLKIEEGENSNPVWTPNSAEMLGTPGANYTENLLTGTRDFTGEWNHLDRGTVTSDTYKGCRVFETTRQWGGTSKPVHLEPGTYTFSAYARVSSQEQVNIYLNDAYNTQPVIGTEWQRVRFVFKVDTAGSYIPRIEKHLATSTVLYMAGYKVEEGDNPGPVWSPAPSEQVGQSAKTVIVNSDATAFMYEDNFNKLTGPNTINLTATLQGTTGYQWSYKTPSMAAFVDMQGMTSATYSLSPTASGWGSDKSMTLRCTSGGVHDEVTIAKVSSGAKGANGSNFTENLLLNTAFTNGFDKWTNWGGPPTREIVTENGKSWFHLVADDKYMYQGLCQSIYHDVEDSTVYTFSALVRGAAPDQLFSVGVHYLNGTTIVAQTWTRWRIGTTPQRVRWVFGTWNNPTHLTVMIGRTDTEVSDIYITDVKLEKGDNHSPAWSPAASEMLGTDAYTVLLTNESHTFAGDSEKAVASSTDCGIVAYKGATQVAATIGAISGMPSGMTAAVSGNGTASARFTVSVTTALTQRQGTLDVPVTVDGKTFTKKFSWSLSLEGKGAHSISVRSFGYGSASTGGAGHVKVDGTDILGPTGRGVTVLTIDRTTLKKVGQATFDLWEGAPGIASERNNFILNIREIPDSMFVCMVMRDAVNWTQPMVDAMKTLGSSGDIDTADTHRTFAFIGHKGLPPGYALQMQGENQGTPPAEVSAYVANGMFTTSKTQNGVKSITEEYYLSTSRDTPTGGSWSATRPAWVAGRFYWTRVKITYTDGTTEYKGAICATGEPGRDGQDGEPGRPGADATFSPNLVPSIIYDPNLKGGGSTNAVKWLNTGGNFYRIGLAHAPIKTAGWYSVYFMARRVSGAGAMTVDINDCVVNISPSLSTIDSTWRAFSGKVYVDNLIGSHGFIDFSNGDGIELSDITVTRGEAVPTSWHPTTPELNGGNDNLLLRSDVEVSNADYPTYIYRLAEVPSHGEDCAITLWGELSPSGPAGYMFGAYNSGGYVRLCNPTKVADGVYSARFKWKNYNSSPDESTAVKDPTSVFIFAMPNKQLTNTIHRIKLERGTIPTPWSRSSHEFDYIGAAMKQDTEVIGGLILSALMKLGVKDASGVRRIMAGVNGLVNSSDDLALWAGGDMVDAEKFPNDPDRAAAAIRHNGTAYFARNVIRMLSDHMMVGDNVRLDKDGLKLMVDGNTSLEITNKDVYTDFKKLVSNQTRFSYNARIGPSIGVESGNSVIVEETYDAVSLGEIEAGTQVVVNIALEGVQDSRNFGNGSVNSPFSQPLTVIAHCGSTAVHQTTMPVHSMTVTHNDAYGRPSWSEHTYRIIGTTTFTASKTGTYEIEITFLKESSAARLGWFSLEGTMSGTVKLALSNQMTIGRNGLSVIRNNNALAINDSMIVMRSDRFGFALHPTLGPVITLNSGTNWYAAQLSGSQILFNKRVSL